MALKHTVLIAALSGESMTSTTHIVVVGFGFVLFVLGTLALVTALFPRLFIHFSRRQKIQKESQPLGHIQSEGATPIIPIIAAAVHYTLGERPHKIVSVQTMDRDVNENKSTHP